ncbi:MAG: ATP-binding cassette, subfamily multidrug efflux pump [Chloroflexota bacterium]|nr:ATP-binding cassette, subfamily multidrug efflux pump [Chloroflexota bacterium]
MSSARATYLHYVGRHRTQLLLGTLAVAAGSIAAVVPPRFIGQLVDGLSHGTTMDTIVELALLALVFSALEAVFRAAGRYFMMNTSRFMEYDMRNDLFAHLQRMHLGYFQHQRIGDLMARMTNDLSATRMMQGPGVMNIVSTSMTFAFTIISMLGVSLKLTLISVVLMPLVSLTFWLIGRRVHVKFERLQAQFSEMSTAAQENFSGIRVVKAFSQENAEVGRFAAVNEEYVSRAINLRRMDGLIWPTMSFILGLSVLATLWIGGQDAIEGRMTLGQLVQFVAYLNLLAWPMIALGWVSNLFQQGWASLQRLQEIWDAHPDIADPTEPASSAIRGHVEFRNVSFAYGPTTVLRDVSFTVPAGGSLAIVGHTGSGKSSLVNLIPRLFDATGGEILIDGVDVKRYPVPLLRRAVGYVPQETFLFSVPLRENVGFGVEAALPDAKLDWAGDVSQLNKDVEDFPARFDTMIGERGVTLSGGQKQRTAIARAVAKDPKILILDDAMSAVDTYTESEILRRLRGVMQERTSIVVAHRISTVKDADEILVLDEGRIAERGTHRELLERNGIYAQMYRRQLLEEELDVDTEREEHERRVNAAHEDPPAPFRTRMGGGGMGENA